MGSFGKAQQATETGLLKSTTEATDKAAAIDPALQQERDYWTKIKKWATGEAGPIDVRNMPGGDMDLALFRDAKGAHDEGRKGTGLATLSDGANPTFTAALAKEMDLEKGLAASGALEGRIENKVANADAALTGIGTQQANQNLQVASLREGTWKDYLNRPARPNPWLQLAMGGLQAAGQVGAGLASYGGMAAL